MNDDEKIQLAIEAARNLLDHTSNADGTCYIVDGDAWDALDDALRDLDCTCNPAFPYLGDCDVHGLEMPF